MNRRKNPAITAEVRIIHRDALNGVLTVRLTNTSPVLATHYRAVVEMPVFLSGWYIRFEDSTPLEVKEDGGYYWDIVFRNGIGAPLFPDCALIHKSAFNRAPGIADMHGKLVESVKDIGLTVYADAMEPIRLTKGVSMAEKGWA